MFCLKTLENNIIHTFILEKEYCREDAIATDWGLKLNLEHVGSRRRFQVEHYSTRLDNPPQYRSYRPKKNNKWNIKHLDVQYNNKPLIVVA